MLIVHEKNTILWFLLFCLLQYFDAIRWHDFQFLYFGSHLKSQQQFSIFDVLIQLCFYEELLSIKSTRVFFFPIEIYNETNQF